MTNRLLTNSELAALSERVDRWADGDGTAITAEHVSVMLAEIIELRRRRAGALLALDGRSHDVSLAEM